MNLAIRKPRYAAVRRKANALLEESGVKRAPVAVERLAARLGATIRYEPFPGQLSGMVHRAGGEKIIGVNSLHPPTRQRFTIAHEIGHLVMHDDDQLHVDEKFPVAFRSDLSGQAVDASEIEANQFAAELLMPRQLLASDIRELPANIDAEDAVRKLAIKYEVSEQAMTFRLSALKYVV